MSIQASLHPYGEQIHLVDILPFFFKLLWLFTFYWAPLLESGLLKKDRAAPFKASSFIFKVDPYWPGGHNFPQSCLPCKCIHSPYGQLWCCIYETTNPAALVPVEILQDHSEVDAEDDTDKNDADDANADTQIDHGPGRVGTRGGRRKVSTRYGRSSLKKRDSTWRKSIQLVHPLTTHHWKIQHVWFLPVQSQYT